MEPNFISLGDLGIVVESLSSLTGAVFSDFQNKSKNGQWLSERVILTPLNEPTNAVNKQLANRVL